MCTFFAYFTCFMSHFFCAALILCLTLFVLHFFLSVPCSRCTFLCVALFSFAPFLVLLHVAFFLCCTHFVLHYFHIALFSSFTFLCCTLLVLHFSVLHFLHFALFLSITFFVLYLFRVALFSCSTLFMSHLFLCCTVFMLHFLCTLFMLHFFRVEHLLCCTFPILHFFHVELFSSCTFFMLHLFACCTRFMLHLFSCCLMLQFSGIEAGNFIKKRLHHRCFPVKFVKILRTPILDNICERLLRKIFSHKLSQCQSLTIYTMFPSYRIAIAPFQFSYRIGHLFPLESVFSA